MLNKRLQKLLTYDIEKVMSDSGVGHSTGETEIKIVSHIDSECTVAIHLLY
nr:MAG TPA: hypothetical protein [Caudoviricetes sp.]